MSQRERNEWIERAKERVLRNAKETDTYARDIMDLYDETANQLENEINAMFQKYAQDNKLNNAEAEKLLSSEEYSRWRIRCLLSPGSAEKSSFFRRFIFR